MQIRHFGTGAIIHPAVKKYLADRLAEAKNKGDVELFFVEAALLIESGYEHIVDEMWYIYAREDVRRRRLSESRNYTPEKIEKIIASQLSEEEFRQHCDFVIDNSDSPGRQLRQMRSETGGIFMEGVKEKQGQLVFGLDIGTRSIVGTVGYLNGRRSSMCWHKALQGA